MYFATSRAPLGYMLLAGLSAVAISMFARPVVADEAFLCGPDSIIYVSVADLPKMKRTNACIAAYFGLTVEEPAQVVANLAPKQANAKAVSAQRSKSEAHAALKPRLAPETSSRDAAEPVRQALLVRPVAAPGTDFRNVKILNATSDEDSVFRHTK